MTGRGEAADAGDLPVEVFDFDLPDDRIALRPADPRDSARLLAVSDDGLCDRVVRDLPDLLEPDDLLIVNDTRVLNAQLSGSRPPRPEGGGGEVVIDATLIERLAPDRWRALARPLKRLRADDVIDFGGLEGRVCTVREGTVEFEFDRSGAELDAAILRSGAPPLPPYISRRRPADERDRSDYQTIFAAEDGSVAAPTAGLHFTTELLDALERRGVGLARVTLHVGAGTFLPVTADVVGDHVMHAEYGVVPEATAEAVNGARRRGSKVIAVGTTSLRILESACGSDGRIRAFAGKTDIFITPGRAVRSIDRLLTNFHLPRSTLFMLVCALAGVERMKAAYAHAIDRGYRFYSYGDACLIDNVTRGSQ